MNFRTSRKVMWALFACGALVGLLGIERPAVLVAGVVIVWAGLGVVLLFWVCPHCGRSLPSREAKIQYCPYCGKKLD